MTGEKWVKDLMINIFDYPHVPYWFSIGQAAQLVRMSFAGPGERPDPIALLVFDEKYNLVGTLGRNEILKGLGPENWMNAPEGSDMQADIMDDFRSVAKTRSERPVSETMVPVRHYVEPDDPVTQAALLMVRNGLLLLPVLEGKKKFVGVIRMAEVFDDLAGGIE